MNPFLLAPQERLEHWKHFRRSLPALAEATQLQAVATYWAQAPVGRPAYDFSAPASWPTPWEMINAGEWCRNSVAIGMDATLRLSGWSASRLCLRQSLDRSNAEMILLLRVDSDWVLNYSWGSVSPCPRTADHVLQAWRFDGRHYVSDIGGI